MQNLKFLLTFFCFLLVHCSSTFAAANIPEAGRTYLFSEVPVQIVELEEDGSGLGFATLSFLEETFSVRFENLRTDDFGNIVAGKVYGEIPLNSIDPNTIGSLASYKQAASESGTLPRMLNPWAVNQNLNLLGHNLFLTGFEVNADGLFSNLMLICETPEDQLLIFNRERVFFGQLGPDWCLLEMFMQDPIITDDPEISITIKKGSLISFNCNGLDSFKLDCEYIFPKDKFVGLIDTKPVVAKFKIQGKSFNNFIGETTVDPFKIVGVDGFVFTIKNAVIDYSTTAISQNMDNCLNSICYGDQEGLKDIYADKTWRGFFIQELSVTIPELFKENGNSMSINFNNLIIDQGRGVTGSLLTEFSGEGIGTDGIQGWGIRLKKISLNMAASSFSCDGLVVDGGVRIPIMEDYMPYKAIFNNQKIQFAINTAGSYVIPFLKGSKMTLTDGSSAGFYLVGSNFQPYAMFNGSFDLIIDKIKLPALKFENFSIDKDLYEKAVAAVGQVGGEIQNTYNSVTGGLDKIKFGSFSLAGIKYVQSDNSQTQVSPSESTVQKPEQDKYSGFPLSFTDIGWISANGGYGFKFTTKVNLADGLDAFSASGTINILFGLEFDKLSTDNPWNAINFKAINLSSFSVNANLGAVALNGSLCENTQNGQSGFIASLEMSIEALELTIGANGIFGADEINKYRYFGVDANVVGFELPIFLGLSIYGFSGGLYYNMTNSVSSKFGENLSTPTPTNQSSEPIKPPANCTSVSYTPSRNSFGFKAGVIFGLTGASEVFSADVVLGMEFSSGNNNLGSPIITFEGDAFVMNEGLSARKNAMLSLCLNLTFGFDPNLGSNTLSGSLGGKINVVNILAGEYNGQCSATNIFFGGKGKNYFYLGKAPMNDRLALEMEIQGIDLGTVKGYFMVGEGFKKGEMDLPNLSDIFAGWNISGLETLNIQRTNSADAPGQSGVGFGVIIDVGGTFSYLAMEATLKVKAGFDLLIKQAKNSCTGPGGWTMEGGVYAGVMGDLSLMLDLGFIPKAKYEIFQFMLAAGLQAKFPNPFLIQGFLAGEYKLFDGLVEGNFNYKFKMEKASPGGCEEGQADPPIDIGKIPWISQILPIKDEAIEIYQNAAVSFLHPPGVALGFNYKTGVDNQGESTFRHVSITPRISFFKIMDGQTVVTNTFEIKDNKKVARSTKTEVFKPLHTYKLHLQLQFDCTEGCDVVTGSRTLDTIVTFRTKAFPNEIVHEMFKDAAPGKDQWYWHKGYAQPLMEFAENGLLCRFFPQDTTVSNMPLPNEEAANYFRSLGYSTSLNNGAYFLSGTFQYEYKVILTNMKVPLPVLDNLNERPITSSNYPIYNLGNSSNFTFTLNQSGSNPPQQANRQELSVTLPNCDNNKTCPTFSRVQVGSFSYIKLSSTLCSEEKIIAYPDLNTKDLEKGAVYKIDIIRRIKINRAAVAKVLSGVTEKEKTFNNFITGDSVVSKSLSSSYNKTEVSYGASNVLASILLKDRILYKNHRFGISRYNSINDKISAIFNAPVYYGRTSTSNSWNLMGRDVLNNFTPDLAYSDPIYMLNTASEGLDYFDLIKYYNNTTWVNSVGDWRYQKIFENEFFGYNSTQRDFSGDNSKPGLFYIKPNYNATYFEYVVRFNNNSTNWNTFTNFILDKWSYSFKERWQISNNSDDFGDIPSPKSLDNYNSIPSSSGNLFLRDNLPRNLYNVLSVYKKQADLANVIYYSNNFAFDYPEWMVNEGRVTQSMNRRLGDISHIRLFWENNTVQGLWNWLATQGDKQNYTVNLNWKRLPSTPPKYIGSLHNSNPTSIKLSLINYWGTSNSNFPYVPTPGDPTINWCKCGDIVSIKFDRDNTHLRIMDDWTSPISNRHFISRQLRDNSNYFKWKINCRDKLDGTVLLNDDKIYFQSQQWRDRYLFADNFWDAKRTAPQKEVSGNFFERDNITWTVNSNDRFLTYSSSFILYRTGTIYKLHSHDLRYLKSGNTERSPYEVTTHNGRIDSGDYWKFEKR